MLACFCSPRYFSLTLALTQVLEVHTDPLKVLEVTCNSSFVLGVSEEVWESIPSLLVCCTLALLLDHIFLKQLLLVALVTHLDKKKGT